MSSYQYLEGFNVCYQTEKYTYNSAGRSFSDPIPVPPNTLEVPSAIADTIYKLKSLGLIQKDTQLAFRLTLNPVSGEEKANTCFLVQPGLNYYPSMALLLQPTGKVVISRGVLFAGMGWDEFEFIVTRKFKNMNTPVNGWEVFYFLDYVTSWSHKWSQMEVNLIDDFLTQGLSVEVAAKWMTEGFEVEGLENLIGVPDSWIEHVF